MSGIEKMKFNVIQIALVQVCAFFGEDEIVLSLDNQCRRLMPAKVGLPLRVQRRV